jgi:hypothetical protein
MCCQNSNFSETFELIIILFAFSPLLLMLAHLLHLWLLWLRICYAVPYIVWRHTYAGVGPVLNIFLPEIHEQLWCSLFWNDGSPLFGVNVHRSRLKSEVISLTASSTFNIRFLNPRRYTKFWKWSTLKCSRTVMIIFHRKYILRSHIYCDVNLVLSVNKFHIGISLKFQQEHRSIH